jgi:hypothetical protein
MRRHRHDDDDAFDEHGLLRDGHAYVVSLTMRDSLPPLQRAVANLRVTDGEGGTRGLSRPGFRLAVSDARRKTVQRDPMGRVLSTWESEEDEDERRTSDTATRDARQRAYDDYQRELTSAYLKPTGIGERKSVGQQGNDDDILCPECHGSGLDANLAECKRCHGEGTVPAYEADDSTTHSDSADHYAAYDAEVSNAWRRGG